MAHHDVQLAAHAKTTPPPKLFSGREPIFILYISRSLFKHHKINFPSQIAYRLNNGDLDLAVIFPCNSPTTSQLLSPLFTARLASDGALILVSILCASFPSAPHLRKMEQASRGLSRRCGSSRATFAIDECTYNPDHRSIHNSPRGLWAEATTCQSDC